MPGEPPYPTPIFRLIHVESLAACLRRGGLHAPNHAPADGLVHPPIHRQDLAELRQVDWGMVYQQYWSDSADDMDRQRRKQAEFLVHRACPWVSIEVS